MTDLFQRRALYDDDGKLLTELPFNFGSGTFSEVAHSTATGSIESIYDGYSTTFYTLVDDTTARAVNLKWDFGRKIRFKNIYCYSKAIIGTIILEGSNDNINWTSLDSYVGGGGDTYANLTATSVRYRYIRLGSTSVKRFAVATIKGVT